METRTANSEPGTKNIFTYFIHDGWNVISEFSSSPTLPDSNSPSLRLVWGHDISNTPQGAGGIGGLLASSTPNGEQRTANWFTYDSNGNVVLLTNAEGKESARYSYDAFGKTLVATGEAAQTNKYQFSTKPVEAGSGLAYYGFRYYSPDLGRWPSRDPIAERGGVNLYGMARNNALNFWDYLGQTPASCGCDESAINFGESSLRDQAAAVKSKLDSGTATDLTSDYTPSCKNNHLYLMSKLRIPMCWECRMEVGYATFLGMLTNGDGGWKDHAVVICRALPSSGNEGKRIILDITGGYTDPDTWRTNYPGEHPDQDVMWTPSNV